jgi:16S rRNA processing protein RimM
VPLVRVGVLQGSFGVSGYARFACCTDRPEHLSTRPSYVLADPVTGEALPVKLIDAKLQQGRFLALLDAFDSPEALKPYGGWELLYHAQRGALPREAGEVYCFELPGLEVRDGQGAALGSVRGVVHSGAHWLLQLDTLPTRLIPFTAQFVPEVNLEQGYLVCLYPLDEVVEP